MLFTMHHLRPSRRMKKSADCNALLHKMPTCIQMRKMQGSETYFRIDLYLLACSPLFLSFFFFKYKMENLFIVIQKVGGQNNWTSTYHTSDYVWQSEREASCCSSLFFHSMLMIIVNLVEHALKLQPLSVHRL